MNEKELLAKIKSIAIPNIQTKPFLANKKVEKTHKLLMVGSIVIAITGIALLIGCIALAIAGISICGLTAIFFIVSISLLYVEITAYEFMSSYWFTLCVVPSKNYQCFKLTNSIGTREYYTLGQLINQLEIEPTRIVRELYLAAHAHQQLLESASEEALLIKARQEVDKELSLGRLAQGESVGLTNQWS